MGFGGFRREYAFTGLLSCLLAACAPQPPAPPQAQMHHPRPKPVRVAHPEPEEEEEQQPAPQPPSYSAEDFVRSLAMTILTPPGHAPDSGSLQIITTYSLTPHMAVRRTVLKVDYTLAKSHGTQHLIVAVLPGEAISADALAPAFGRLAAQRATLQDVQPVYATIAPHAENASGSVGGIRAQAAFMEAQLLRDTQIPPPLVDAQLQLALVKAFIQLHERDAAYLALDNARHALADASQDTHANAQEIHRLTNLMEVREETLHNAMPYGFRLP
jgi:hypothetical protein